jgi:hypothetical protein
VATYLRKAQKNCGETTFRRKNLVTKSEDCFSLCKTHSYEMDEIGSLGSFEGLPASAALVVAEFGEFQRCLVANHEAGPGPLKRRLRARL